MVNFDYENKMFLNSSFPKLLVLPGYKELVKDKQWQGIL